MQTAEEYNKKFENDLKDNEENRVKIEDILLKSLRDNEILKKKIEDDLSDAIN